MTTRQRIIYSILSIVLSSCSLAERSTPERLVRVKILGDPAVRQANARWQNEIEEKFEAAADFFHKEFGIRLLASKVQPLKLHSNMTSTAELLRYLREQVSIGDEEGNYDLVIAFTSLPGRIRPGHGRVDEIGNCRDGLGRYVAISATETFRKSERSSALGNTDVLTLIHELGHIFGAEHVNNSSSIMNVHFQPFSDFDSKNRDIILTNKFCPFRKG